MKPTDSCRIVATTVRNSLMTVVEVIPLVAGTAPVIIRGGVVGAVVGVLGLLVQGAGLGVLDERLGVQVGRLLAVEDGAHLATNIDITNWSAGINS
jgi:hypothetical protein